MTWVIVMSVTNSQKPSAAATKPKSWPDNVLSRFAHQSLYVEDFNSHHRLLRYSSDVLNGNALVNWAGTSNISIIFDTRTRFLFIQLGGGGATIQTCVFVPKATTELYQQSIAFLVISQTVNTVQSSSTSE